MSEQAEDTRVVVARIARPRGNRGEVVADLYTDFPERFERLSEIWLVFPDGHCESGLLEESWDHRGRKVLKFRGVDDITAAERLAGAWVEIPSSEALELPGHCYYDHDLEGCRVTDLQGRELGKVLYVWRIAGNHQLVIQGEHGEILLPAVESICRRISIAEKWIEVDLPEGLVDLNT